MSSENSNISCAFCHAYLFDEDDVVYCPVCGAPHHRECYNKINHCALEELHGTENQYDLLKKKSEQEQDSKQTSSEQSYKNDQSDIPPFNSRFGNTVYIDLLGGVPKDYDLGEGVTANQAKDFVFSNTMRYIPKFAKFKEGSKVSWNFLAFLFPCGWFLSRKMYKNGIIAGILSVISNLLVLPLVKLINEMNVPINATSYEIAQILTQNLDNITLTIILVAFIGSILEIAIQIICGLFGDYLYRNHVISAITKIKDTSSDLQTDYRKKGGVNFILFFIGTTIVQYLPLIISSFI